MIILDWKSQLNNKMCVSIRDHCFWLGAAGPILENKGMCTIFQKKGKKMLKKGKIFLKKLACY